MLRRRPWLLTILPLLIATLIAGQLLLWGATTSAQSLSTFSSCTDLLQYFRAQQRDAIDQQTDFLGDFGDEDDSVQQDAAAFDDAFDAAAATESVGPDAAQSAPSDGGDVSETGTNVQERGVDEADIIKSDGRYLYILRQHVLVIARVVKDGPVEEITRFWFDRSSSRQELLLGDQKLIVVRQLPGVTEPIEIDIPADGLIRPFEPQQRYRDQSEILEFDIGQPWNLRLLRELDLDGRYLTARLVDGNVRIAFQQQIDVPIVYPWQFRSLDPQDAAQDYNEALVDDLGAGDLLPLFGYRDHVNNSAASGVALECDQIYAPDAGQHQSLSYLLSFNLKRGMGQRGSVAMLSNEPTIYASADSFYLAAPRYGGEWDTLIHRFDIADPLQPTYYGSGAVRGHLLSQWAMSEHDGYLRVATTIRDLWPRVSNVFVLEPRPQDLDETRGTLEQVGLVSGLGVDEEIFAVRFSGNVGYVVTFRQTDPLYSLDLSDPTMPKALGELKIPGFSRYLHPLGDHLLLGVGRDADPETGRVRGLQASLFDVSEPTSPVQLDVLMLGDDAQSLVESDHRAFRYYNGIAWIPVGPSRWDFWQEHDGAYLGIVVNEASLSHRATLRVQGAAFRVIPQDDLVHILSSDEVRTFAVEGYGDIGSLRFADEWDTNWVPIAPE